MNRSSNAEYRNTLENALDPSDDEDIYSDKTDQDYDGCLGYRADGPFSALTRSMWPEDVLKEVSSPPEDESGQVDFRYNEFGFKVEVEDGPEQNSSKLLSTPFTEDSKHRLKWIAHLEFSHCQDSSLFSIEKISDRLSVSHKLLDMIREQGIPHSLRPHIWPRLTGALTKRKTSQQSYHQIVKASSNEQLMTSKQIEKDLLRTLPTNACFCNSSSTGIARLRRILRCLAWLYPDIGYCQGMGMIVASILLYMEEEDTFWMTCSIIEDILPSSYFSNSLIGVQADQKVLCELISTCLPEVDTIFKTYDIDISLISLHWFLTVYSSVLHPRILLRVWDLVFVEGSVVLFKIALGLLKLHIDVIIASTSSAQIFNTLSDIPYHIDDIDELLSAADLTSQSLSQGLIDSQRRKHLAQIMVDHGAILNPDQTRNLPKQQLTKRHVQKTSNLFTSLLWGDNYDDDGKAKNVKQTELLVDFREAILKIGRYFQSIDPCKNHTNLSADYSPISHKYDLEKYIAVAKNRRLRAKALTDFDKHDEDELGFKRNDIINLISTADEHCWVGEVRGQAGWFPAKFVELLDERTKVYTVAGDESVSEQITDLVRGVLCPAVKALLEHGLKRSHILGSPAHPWLFIEEVATKEIEKDYKSVYTRLVLCKTFRLDDDCKVLTPEEVLFRAVHSVNASHDAVHAQMDVKLRSLICCGLNEQVLHLWLEALCSSESIVRKWYHPWSFLRSPGWVQIKCDMRVLGQFAFNLDPDMEITKPGSKWDVTFEKNIHELLAKYHLFSWELTS